MNARPDIIFFMLDQLSAKWLESAMDGACSTPNVRRLQDRGVTFTRAISSNPVCMPARATLATGLTTRQHGVIQNGYSLDPSIPTFMRLLQQNGWRTGAFGKLHLVPHYSGVHPDYGVYGFDVVKNTEDARAGQWLDWVRDEHPEHLEDVLRDIWPFEIPEMRAYGPDREDLTARIAELREGYDWASPEFPEGEAGFHPLHFPEEVSQSAWITRNACEFIRETDPAIPIMAHVSYVQPHGPYVPPRDTIGLVDPDTLPEPIPPTWQDDPDHPRHLDEQLGFPNTIGTNTRAKRHCYFSDIAHLDQQLGKVMDALESAGRADNAYIVFLADHGDMLGDHGFWGKESKHYDSCVRVPLMVAGPGVEAGSTVDAFVQIEDIMPTVLEMAGLAVPEPRKTGPYLTEEPEYLSGRSLLSFCRGQEPGDWRDSAYVESFNTISEAAPHHWSRTVLTERWRYSWYADGGGEQLFDFENDPDETRNLVADPDCGPVRNEMRDRLLEQVVMQDWPHSPRNLFAHGVH
jgi:arylsulfatase